MCTEEDFQHFAPPTQDSQRVLNSILSDPKRGLYCFDWEELSDTLEIWGVSQYEDFRYVDFALVPCNYNHTTAGYVDDVIHEDCIWDK